LTGEHSISPFSSLNNFERLFKTYYDSLCAYANSIIKDYDAVEDIVHEVFIKVWEKRDEMSEKQSIKSYLYTSVHNRCLNFIRDNKKFTQGSEYFENTSDSQDAEEEAIQQAELEAKVHAAINTLPEKCKEVFTLCKLEGKKYAEVSEILGISVKTIENQMGKALKVLRTELGSLFLLASIIFFNELVGVFDTALCIM